jgi:hypothetical protein
VGKPRGRRPLGRPRHCWEDNVKKKTSDGKLWAGLIWLGTGTSGRLVNIVRNLQVSKHVENFLTG